MNLLHISGYLLDVNINLVLLNCSFW